MKPLVRINLPPVRNMLIEILVDRSRRRPAHLIAELLERHDRARFEIIGFSYGRQHDAWRRRIEEAVDRMVECASSADAEVAGLARQAEIDIAVDLKGYTRNARPGIFAFRAAPVQVSYLGYPGTMGMDCIDYIIADSTLIPISLRFERVGTRLRWKCRARNPQIRYSKPVATASHAA